MVKEEYYIIDGIDIRKLTMDDMRKLPGMQREDLRIARINYLQMIRQEERKELLKLQKRAFYQTLEGKAYSKESKRKHYLRKKAGLLMWQVKK